MAPKKLLHLIYIHGFQGNDTTFQRFPTDLQQYLAERMPPHIDVQSSLYPTYKSVRPISFATKNFLEWLTTQPPGPVIVVGHSMGGLLAAEAATDQSNRARTRIVGMLAFDTPFLGMHPHVVITGIASLFPKDENEKPGREGERKPTEREMNGEEAGVKIVDEGVTDDWEKFKRESRNGHSHHSSHSSLSGNSSYHTPSPSPTPSPLASPSLTPQPQSPPASLLDRGVSFFTSHADDPLVRWVRKHSDDPLGAGKRWVVEHFQFGICMFDPAGLRERYANLVKWDGVWVNYWTETPARARSKSPAQVEAGDAEAGDAEAEGRTDNDVALLQSGSVDVGTSTPPPPSREPSEAPPESTWSPPSSPEPPAHGPPTKSEAKAAQKAAESSAKAREKEARNAQKAQDKAVKHAEKARAKEAKRAEKAQRAPPARHFIVLPTGLGRALGGGEKWESVRIDGVGDEVGAHCGLFIREQNWEYDALVERVAGRVLEWCKGV